MTTALQLITRAFQEAGIAYKQEGLDADESSDALSILNDMLQQWVLFGFNSVVSTRESFSSTGAANYTIGVGGDFDTSKPLVIKNIFTRSGSVDYPVYPMDDDAFIGIGTKNTQGTPDYYNYADNYPLGLLTFFPVPDASHTIYIYSEKPIAAISSLSSTVTLPVGWEGAIPPNLGMKLCSSFGQPASAELINNAKMSLAAIKTMAARNIRTEAYPKQASKGNIYNGWNL